MKDVFNMEKPIRRFGAGIDCYLVNEHEPHLVWTPDGMVKCEGKHDEFSFGERKA